MEPDTGMTMSEGMATQVESVGEVLREWRARRRLSQLHLAIEADVSARHLSFVESGRSAPSRELLLRLAEPLEMPLHERNRLLLAAGYAPMFAEHPLDAPEMTAAMAAVKRILDSHAPFPALAVDRGWDLLLANDAALGLLAGIDNALLNPPVNLMRLSLHPEGLAPRIHNLAEWRHHLLGRLRDDANRSGDARLFALQEELRAFPAPASSEPPGPVARIAVPLVLSRPGSGERLSFLSTTTVFGTATDIALAGLTLECFYPADDATRIALVAAKPD